MDRVLVERDKVNDSGRGEFAGPRVPLSHRRPVGDAAANEQQGTSTPSPRSAGAIRFARITSQEDVIRSLPIAREFHEESRYSHIAFSEAKFLKVYGSIVGKSDRTFGVLAERDGEIIGVVLAEVGQYFLGDGDRIATNHVLYVSDRLRRSTVGGGG